MSLEISYLAETEVTRYLSSGAAGRVGADLQAGFLGDRVGETRSGKKCERRGLLPIYY